MADGEWQIANRKSQIANPDEAEARSTQHATRNTQHAIDSRVAYLITDILSDEVARMAAFGEGNALEIGRPAAAKTGTTTDWRDNWTVGYTPDLATGVWVGNADNLPMKDVSGITGAGPIWHDFMTTVLRDTSPREFPRPEGLVRVEICADSGLLPAECGVRNAECGAPSAECRVPSAECLNPQSETVPCPYRRAEWFIAGTEPTQVDDMHRQVAIDARTGAPADAVTPPEFIAAETVWILPEEYRTWARENEIPQSAAIAEGQPAANGPVSSFQPPASNFQLPVSSFQLTSPDPNRVYRLDPGLPASSQRVPITAQPGSDIAPDAIVTLLLDGAAFAQVRGPEYTAWWLLSRGRHVWQALVTGPDGGPIESEQVAVFVE
jgi:membrane peptidoglycan carboxypeptidase